MDISWPFPYNAIQRFYTGPGTHQSTCLTVVSRNRLHCSWLILKSCFIWIFLLRYIALYMLCVRTLLGGFVDVYIWLHDRVNAVTVPVLSRFYSDLCQYTQTKRTLHLACNHLFHSLHLVPQNKYRNETFPTALNRLIYIIISLLYHIHKHNSPMYCFCPEKRCVFS